MADRSHHPSNHEAPVTLHEVIRDTIGRELQARYEPEREIPHRLLTLLMQLNEDKRRAESTN